MIYSSSAVARIPGFVKTVLSSKALYDNLNQVLRSIPNTGLSPAQSSIEIDEKQIQAIEAFAAAVRASVMTYHPTSFLIVRNIDYVRILDLKSTLVTINQDKLNLHNANRLALMQDDNIDDYSDDIKDEIVNDPSYKMDSITRKCHVAVDFELRLINLIDVIYPNLSNIPAVIMSGDQISLKL